MANHGSGTEPPIVSHPNQSRFTLPLNASYLSPLRRIFNVLSPFVSNSSGERTLRIQPRRLSAHINERVLLGTTTFEPLSRERHRQRSMGLLGHWSSDDIQVQSEIAESLSPRRNSLGNINTYQTTRMDEDVVINMETNFLRGETINPLVSRRNSNDNLHSVTGEGDVEEQITTGEPTSVAEDNTQQTEEGGPGVRINGESVGDIVERYPEVRDLLKALWQYCIFVLIILAKVIFDRFTSLLVLLLFWLTFVISNRIVKRVLAESERISVRVAIVLISVFFLIPLGIYLFYQNASDKLYYSAILLPPDFDVLTLGDLLWIVIITDYVIKLTTIFIKAIYAAIPCVFVHHKRRGKHLALVEITSQLYRSLAPVQPWLSYLFNNYTGIQKVFGVFLSTAYMLCKGPDLLKRARRFYQTFKKFLEDTNYGSTPTTAQLKDSGDVCPICQDDFIIPTMLQCKHIFCEQCVARWFDRERTCPMCRTKIVDNPKYRDGGTSHSIQLY